MATPDELKTLYGEMRAALLSRHFAITRYFRANYLSWGDRLGVVIDLGKNYPTPPEQDDLSLPCNQGSRKPPTYDNAEKLRKLKTDNPYQELIERWRIWHYRENPLMHTGQLFICLVVEYLLGAPESGRILREALQSVGSLYKFKYEHFKGYIIRWDAVTSDRWVTTAITTTDSYGSWMLFAGRDFPPFIGLTGLDDRDTMVHDSYIGWFRGWFRREERGCFATAVALVLGAGEGDLLEAQEFFRKLVGKLNWWYMDLVGKWKRDLDFSDP